MPPRPPPKPFALTVLSTLSALAAGWVAVAIEQSGRGLAGAALGVSFRGLAVGAPTFTATAVQGPTGHVGAGAWLVMTLAGPLLVLVAAALAYGLTAALRPAGWLRSLSLTGLVLALLWMPTALVASAVPGGGGPVAMVYRRLGDPPAGRWGAAGLALLLLWLLAGVASRRAVATGRAWIRADGLEFRRRLVRVVAGWPVAIASAVLATSLGWMPPAVAAVWGVILLLAMVFRTA